MSTRRYQYFERHFKWSVASLCEYEDDMPVLNGCQRGMIKFVKPKNARAGVRVPEETRTKGRVYATIGKDGKIKAITRYDKNGKKCLQIDLTHPHKGLKPHAHVGYNHADGRRLSKSEKALMERILKYWKEYQDGK